METFALMFDQVVKAVGNAENWQPNADGDVVLNWAFVDADVYAYFDPAPADVAQHYADYEAACTALEEARGEPYPADK